jgi:hypothetical protein
MNILTSFLLMFLTPTDKIPQAGLWFHDQDTLVITNTEVYYTNSNNISWECSSTGKVSSGFLVGSCVSGGIPIRLQSKDTLYVVTTSACEPYVRLKNLEIKLKE